MKPKEKAKELVEIYLKKVIELAYAETKTLELAKESALICVDEVIKESMIYKNHLSPNEIIEGSHIYGEFEERIDYLGAVKLEIKKL